MNRTTALRGAAGLGIALVLSCLVPRAGAAPRDAIPGVETYLARLEKFGFAGAIVVMQDDDPLLARGYGFADRGQAIRWTPATGSSVGSITKQFTGAAIMTLVAEGRIEVTDPISNWFPDVPPDKRGITVHQLLTHSSGIVDLMGYGDWDPLGREEFVRLAMAQELAFPPGEGYEYSNAGYSLLGAIVERLSGVPYETCLRERLLLPLGLYETGYVQPRWGDVTLVRYAFARGEEYRAYVWDPEAEASLLGVSRRGLDPVLHVYPVADGGFASWEGRSGASMPLQLDGSRLVLGPDARLEAGRE